jgi:hypothetical protein
MATQQHSLVLNACYLAQQPLKLPFLLLACLGKFFDQPMAPKSTTEWTQIQCLAFLSKDHMKEDMESQKEEGHVKMEREQQNREH